MGNDRYDTPRTNLTRVCVTCTRGWLSATLVLPRASHPRSSQRSGELDSRARDVRVLQGVCVCAICYVRTVRV